MIALVSAGAITLAIGGYAVGATRTDGASVRSATCEQANKEFTRRAGQVRKQKEREFHDEDFLNSVNPDMESAQVKILGLIVEQNPTCFGAGTRATAAYLQQHRTEGEEDAAACELTGVPAKDCSIAVD
ncbi:hypothetical protein [Streptomyces sp. GbtcB6]|uniref:hypothetical protein n=1 Tax=Streptomyces sp. GbtcB6 TaxID=2824751 RepID=UPI001C30F29B|nr:hypothetical protein [Streptomyces sp. GbtcB6]